MQIKKEARKPGTDTPLQAYLSNVHPAARDTTSNFGLSNSAKRVLPHHCLAVP